MRAIPLIFSFFLFTAVLIQAQNNYELVKYPDLPESITVFDIFMRKDGSVYLGTDKGMYYINSFEDEAKRVFAGNEIGRAHV